MTYDNLLKVLEEGFTLAVLQSKRYGDYRIEITPHEHGNWSGYQLSYSHHESDPYFTAREYYYFSSLKDIVFNLIQLDLGKPSEWSIS